MYRFYIKRFLDFSIALVAFLLLLPVVFIVFIVLLVLNNGSPFFTQTRPGKDEKFFKVYKFKTMTDRVDKDGNLLPDAQRLTPAGKFIRKTSMDELPQLINVIKGDMSLIGPRPLLPRYLPFYTAREKVRHKIRPGITGWAQVNGRNTSNWNDRLEADVFYYNNLSFKLDALIFIKTLRSVFLATDVVIDPDSTLDPLDIVRAERIRAHS